MDAQEMIDVTRFHQQWLWEATNVGKPVRKNLCYGANDPRRNTGLALGC